MVLSAPALGAICDLRQSRKPYLVAFTLVTVLCTFALAFSDDLTGSLTVAVVLFVVAVVAYNLINVPYYALLRSAAEGRGTGRISGYAQAAGFIGTFIAVIGLTLLVAPERFLGFTLGGPGEIRQVFGPLGGFVHTAKATVDSNTFLPTAVFFLVFALPAFFFVADVPERAPQQLRLGQAYRNVFATVKGIGAHAGLGAYMVVTLLYMEATLIAIPNMCLFGKDVFGMKDEQISNLIIFSLLFSVVAAFGAGRVSDKIGPKKALLATMGLWVVGILAVTFAWAPWVMYVAAPVIFLANGATLAVGTVLAHRPLAAREAHGIHGALRHGRHGLRRPRTSDRRVASGGVRGTRDGCVPNRHGLHSRGHGARDLPPHRARPRHPQHGRPHVRTTPLLAPFGIMAAPAPVGSYWRKESCSDAR